MEEIKGKKPHEVDFSNINDVCEFGVKLGDLMWKLHKNGIIHCDLKPDNII